MKHYNIPIFIPELACGFQCIYCNQKSISGTLQVPQPEHIIDIIDKHLQSIPQNPSHIEVAFFGGSFTGLGLELQKSYLNIIQPYVKQGRIKGIRISTRPDYIHEENLQLLKQMGVRAIELGVQTLDRDVLKASGRGHSLEDVYESAALIKNAGFELGLQMMIGLPGDTAEKSMKTAISIADMGADTSRIYPCLVIKNTPLADLYLTKQYQPLSMEDAISICASIYNIFVKNGVKVLRMGLHPSEALLDGSDLLAGPFHPSFGEQVLSKVWFEQFKAVPPSQFRDATQICVSPRQLNSAIGYKAQNRKYLEKMYGKIKFKTDSALESFHFYIHHRVN